MRVALIGGTRFIGAATVEDLVAHGHDVLVAHRGHSEPETLPPVEHTHLDRRDVDALRSALDDFRAAAVVDTVAYSRADAQTAVAAIPPDVRAVVLSSQDVYRAFHTVLRGLPATDAVPLDESAPTREGEQRYLYRGEVLPAHDVDPDTYENLDVEEVYAARGATVLRLPMVYGERDHQRREGFVLRRVLAARRRIPFGPGGWLWSKGYVRDVAGAIRQAVEIGPGGVLNIAESRTVTVAAWTRSILATLGHEAELVPVPEELLPDDLWITRAVAQPLLVDASRSRAVLGWNETEPSVALDRSLDWHLAHPPGEVGDLAADDRALEAAS